MNPTQEQLRLQMEMEAEAQEQERQRQQQAVKEPTPTERANMPGYTGPTLSAAPEDPLRDAANTARMMLGPFGQMLPKPSMRPSGSINIMPVGEQLAEMSPAERVSTGIASFGRGLAGGATAGAATRLATSGATIPDFDQMAPDMRERVAQEYMGQADLPSMAGRMAGQVFSPLNKIVPGGGLAKVTAGTALNQAAQSGASDFLEQKGGIDGSSIVRMLVAGGLPILGGALGKILSPKVQPQKVLPEINPALDDATRRQLTNNAYREIAVGSGMSADDANRIIRDRPELAEQTVIEFNRGRDVGAFGPVTSDPSSVIPFRFENVNPPAVADRTLEATRLAEAAKNEARQGIQMRLPVSPIQSRLDEANEALMSSAAGGQEKASRIQTLIERYRNVRARDPNAAKVQSVARARNPMQSMPEAPPPAAKAGNVGGETVDSAFINESSDLNPVSGPLFGYFDDLGRPMQNQDIPGLPKLPNNVRSPISSPVQTLDVAPSSLIEEPVQLSRSAIPVQPSDLPVEGRIGVNPKLVEPGFGTSPNVSVPVSDPTTMGRIRAAQSQARETTVPRDSMQPGAGMNEQQGFLDDIARELALGKDAAAIKDRSTDEAHRAAANALLNALEDIAGTDARLAFERAMTRGSAADDAYKAAGRLAGQGMENVRPSWAGKGAAIASSVSNPIAARWRILNQNRIADKLLARTPADPRIAQMVEWIRSASPGPAQAARFYVAAQREPRLLEEIQNEGKEGE